MVEARRVEVVSSRGLSQEDTIVGNDHPLHPDIGVRWRAQYLNSLRFPDVLRWREHQGGSCIEQADKWTSRQTDRIKVELGYGAVLLVTVTLKPAEKLLEAPTTKQK